MIAKAGRIIGMGHHRAVGRPHAEAEALADCRSRGEDPSGADVYVTLEPCAKPGRNPPCTEALVGARVGRVRYAMADPNPLKCGGAERLRSEGIDCALSTASASAVRVGEPFVKRILTDLPWVIAKWAQTIDGKVATRTGASRWISNDRSRLRVHRTRACVDAVLTGIGTVLADDPRLTARGVPVRRTACRVVIDGALRAPLGCALVATAAQSPVIIATTADALRQRADHAAALASSGVVLMPVTDDRGLLDLRLLLSRLALEHAVATLLVESGPTLMGAMLRAGLVDEAQVYLAPLLLGDDEAPGAAALGVAERLEDGIGFSLVSARPMAGDVRMVFRRPLPTR